MTSCKARQHSDQILCECGLGWDVNDPDPPQCPKLAESTWTPVKPSQVAAIGQKTEQRTPAVGRSWLQHIRTLLATKR
ncbi:hypothetical protein ACUOA7_001912 [Pseudomonas aeruginosa]|uniref:hypothetical protein n=1 Tax=Pseudomonas aeruginosa TaxID=287 RepID=UPI000BB6F072|nr:hypothetical protein [Pseudomonas aeruginosa]MBG7209579.1 hypothetical protein [Pseudomonas aeruginosa]MBH9330639.1 hypothetical protein [Pseudomonas aeruginosa]PBY85520.1 hypothetical protein CJT46_05555 [Pseudomonas aeruginosa]HBO4032063.1 hypothetical protein [Pseudomonas aeruginosa]HCL3411423.1 hypothetical protein [Pseudomonas aeruginosa]